jgi:FAD/FMN-containing dehydrogenase
MTVTTQSHLHLAIRRLRRTLGDRLLQPGDAAYDAARRIWNPAAERHPGAIARCLTVDEIRTVVLTAQEYDVPLSVRAGGHDWAGRALREGGLVLDLTAMRRVKVDPETRTAIVDGAVTAGELLVEAGRHDLVTPTSVVRSVGLTGLAAAGGYGPLNGRYGLTLDNLLSANILLADGRHVTASPDHDAELYWAIRGGGANFGVVTRLCFRLHRLPAVLAGMIMFPLAEAAQVLRGYRELIEDAPRELTVMGGFLPGPAGEPVVFLAPFWSGANLPEGERRINRLRRFGTPLVFEFAPMPYEQSLAMFDAGLIDGNHYYLRTHWLSNVGEPAAEALTAAATGVVSPFSALAMHHFHGAATEVPRTGTAFGFRDGHLLAEIISAWLPAEPAAPHRDWADRTWSSLAPVALPGGYPNLLAPDEHDRVRESYGPNYERLLRAKRRYDPDNVFASAVPTLLLQ